MSAEHEHIDSDGDGKCDICGADMSEAPREKDPLTWLYITLGIVCVALLVAVAVFFLVRKNKNANGEAAEETDENGTAATAEETDENGTAEEAEETEPSPKQDDGDGSEE